MPQDSRLLAALAACRTKLSAFIRGRSERHDEAEDILQEISWKLLQVEQPVENVSAWLFRAARNEITDRSRKNANSRCSTPPETRIFPKMKLLKRCLAWRRRRRMSI